MGSIEHTNDKVEAEKLNKLESQYWLLARLTETLQEGSENFEDVFWRIREIEEQRASIALRLEPLKQVYLSSLNSFQSVANKFPFSTDKSKKYDYIEKVLNELVQNYIHIENASILQVQELFEFLEDQASQLPKAQSLYNARRLLEWVYTQSRNSSSQETEDSNETEIDSEYPPVRAFKIKKRYKPKYHIPGCVGRYPKVERPEDEEGINFYGSIEEAEEAGREICRFCQKRRSGQSTSSDLSTFSNDSTTTSDDPVKI